jgi:CubicO group peptidase (beta-lactamase class C family)
MSDDTTRRAFLKQSIFTGVGVASLLIPSGGITAQADVRFNGVRLRIQEAVRNGSVASIAVAVAAGGRIIWEEAFGWADRERRVPATPRTRYAVASVSKPFTATGLMILSERGLVNLDRSANQYLGSGQITGYAGDASAATLKLILQHRAGLPTHGQFFYTDENYVPPSIDETIRRYGILVNPPGERYTYSNLGYGILAYITARVSRKAYPEFMRTEVFAPLGLTRTSVEIEPRLSSEAARPYANDRTPIPYYIFDEWGSGRIFSTARDVVRFGMFHLKEHLSDQRPILRDETINQMVRDNHTTGTPGGFYGIDWFYGLGWGGREQSEYGYRWYGHEGGMPGVSAQLKLIPSERIAVAVLSNSRQDFTYNTIDSIIDALLPDYPSMRRRDPISGAAPTAAPFAPTQELLGEWRGQIKTWSGTLPVVMAFQADRDVHIKVGEQLETLVNNVRFENGRFTGRCHGTIPAPDVRPSPHNLRLSLTLRGSTLSGTVAAATTNLRDHFYLPSWITLSKQPLSTDGRQNKSFDRTRN